MNVQDLLSRLEGVRSVGNGGYIARCPAHPDKSPSLTVKDSGDRILVHCFAGCEPLDVLYAIDMRWSDLFADKLPESPKSRHRWPAHLLLTALAPDVRWLMYAAHQMHQGEVLAPTDRKRLEQIHERLLAAQELAGVDSTGRAA